MPTVVDHDGYLRKVLSKDERIVFIVRENRLFLFGRIFLWILAEIAIVVGVVLGMVFSTQPGVAFGLFLLLVPAIPIWWSWLVWTNHKYVVTNRRVLQLKGVFGKEVVDASLDQINDVKTEQSFLGRMFDYGDLEVVTASDILSDKMEHIARPLDFKRALMDSKEALTHPTATS